MTIHNFPQGSTAWHRVRCGIPTASNFDKFITGGTLKLANNATSRGYRNKLLAEWLIGKPVEDEYINAYMQRGTELEDEARRKYEFIRDVTVEQVGFVLGVGAGGSPDGLVGDDGMIEIKCYELKHHIGCLLDLDDSHQLQIQGNLWIADRQWCDRIYYNPVLPDVTRRVERDDTTIEAIKLAVGGFKAMLTISQAALIEHDCKPAPPFDASHYDEYGEPIPPPDDAERLQAKFNRKESVTA